MKRVMTLDDTNPKEVIDKIDNFISNEENSEDIMNNIGKLMKDLDATETVINNMEEERFKNEMLGYVQTARVQVMNLVDAVDSMLEV